MGSVDAYALAQVHTIIFKDNSLKREGEMQPTLSADAEQIFQVLGIPMERGVLLKTECRA